MTVDGAILLFAVVVFFAYVVQTMTGFGSAVVCVTFGAQLIGLDEVITLAVPISLVQTIYVLVRHHDGIAWPLLLKRILPLMGSGMALAFVLLADVAASWLKVAFGVMVLVLSVRELFRLRAARGKDEADPPLPRPASYAAILGAGVVHGIFASGGPLLVYSVGREGLSKHAFRSTLCAVWVVLNIVMLGRFALMGRYDAPTGLTLLALTPTIPLGIALGEWLHRKVDERRFKVAVFALLAAAAVSLLVRAVL